MTNDGAAARQVLVSGASGHTGRAVVAALVDRVRRLPLSLVELPEGREAR